MEAVIDRAAVEELTSHFEALNSRVPLRPISNEKDYEKAVAALNQLLDAGTANEDHPLAGLVNTVGSLIGAHEDEHNPVVKCPQTPSCGS